METREQRRTARRLWLEGALTETEIALRLNVDLPALERWRDDEGWHELRDLIDARIAARRETTEENQDARAILLADVIDNIAAKLMQRGAAGVAAKELVELADVVIKTQAIRKNALLMRRDRQLRDKNEPKK